MYSVFFIFVWVYFNIRVKPVSDLYKVIGSKWNKQWNIYNRLSIPEEALRNESYKAVKKDLRKFQEDAETSFRL